MSEEGEEAMRPFEAI